MNNLIARFMPASITREQQEDYRKARTLLLFSFVLLIPSIIYGFVGAFLKFWTLAAMSCFMLVPLYSALPFILRASGSIALTARLMVTSLFVLFAGLLLRDGGIYSSVLCFVPMLVIISLFFLGRKAAAFWTGTMTIYIVGLALVQGLGIQLVPERDQSATYLWTVAAVTGFLPIIYILLSLFDTMIEQSKMTLSKELDNTEKLISAVRDVTESAMQGTLGARADITEVQGGHQRVLEGVHTILELVQNINSDAASVLKSVAEGNFREGITSDYKGDFAVIKSNINRMLESMNTAFYKINDVVDQVSQGAEQVAVSSQELSSGATEQAASLQEITSSIQQIASQTRINAENARQANILAGS